MCAGLRIYFPLQNTTGKIGLELDKEAQGARIDGLE